MPENADGSYPSECDVEWVAVDRHGRIGAFTTGGRGPIPRAYLDAPGVMDAVRDALWALPEHTEGVLIVHVPRPDDFEALARRGCFAFDWTDSTRSTGHSGLYELQARPAAASTFNEAGWPEALRPVLASLVSQSLDFDHLHVDVSSLNCKVSS